MSAESLWPRYAAIWSAPEDVRKAELAACLIDSATYCDPNGLIVGRDALSAYMDGFQESVPDGSAFRIRSVLHHHGRTLAHWALHGPDDAILQRGTSYAELSADGRLSAITGFFNDADMPLASGA